MELVKNIWYGLRNILIPDRFANWKVIILCVIGATTFWFFNALNKSYTTTISYPIDIEFDESRFIAVAPLPDRIQINITGGGWNLLRRTNWFNISPVNISLEDPLQKRISGNSFRSTISDQLGEFQLNFIVTDSLRLQIENRISRKLKLDVDTTSISLEENHFLVSAVSISPDSATFTGPESMVTLLNDPFRVNLTDGAINDDFNKPIIIETGANELFNVEPPNTNISFEVRRFQRITEPVKATLLNFPRNKSWYIQDSVVVLSFLIREDNPVVDSAAFEVILDFRRMVRADSTIQPLIRKFPEYVLGIDIESDRVKVFHD